jgi:hypothetical protein
MNTNGQLGICTIDLMLSTGKEPRDTYCASITNKDNAIIMNFIPTCPNKEVPRTYSTIKVLCLLYSSSLNVIVQVITSHQHSLN